MPELTYFLWGRLFAGGPAMGLAVNLGLAAVGLLAGVVVGVPLGVTRVAAPPWVQMPIGLVLGVIRGTPLLLLVLWSFLLFQVVLAVPLAPYGIGCFALGLYALTHVSDIVRAGALSVSRPQLRSAEALGLSRMQIASTILMPVSVRVMVPALTTFATTLFKDTSACYVIGVVELMQLTLLETSRNPRYLLEYYSLMAFTFLAITLLGTRLAARLERRRHIPGALG